MAKTIILHIGAHKTGSTAIQAFFSRHRQDFLANGLLYPLAGIPPNLTGHHYVPWLFRRQKNGSSAAADSVLALKREIRDSAADTVLISSEDLENQGCPTAEIARELGLESHRCVIVLFIRRQDDLFASAYASQVNQGRHIASLKDFVENLLMQRRGDFYALLMAWRRALRDADLKIVNYSDPAVASDSVGALCGVLKMAMPVKSSVTAKRNVSIHPTHLPFLNFLNRAVADRPEYRHLSIIKPLQRLSAQAPASGIRHFIIDPDLRARIVESYDEANAMLGREFLGGSSPFAFNKEEFRDAVQIDPDVISLSALAQTFRRLVELS